MNTIISNWISVSTRTINILLPNLAFKIAKIALFKPKRKPSYWPRLVTQFDTKTRYGAVKTYKYGEGKCIWLIHGWSGCAFDYWPLMQKLSEKGYSTISFDFPAHGKSSGNQSSLPQMIKAFDDVSQNLFSPHIVVAHGLGASAMANSQWFESYDKDLLLISPILDAFFFLQNLIFHSKFDDELFKQTIDNISRQEKMDFTALGTIPQLRACTGQLKIIHDTQDNIVPFSLSEAFTHLSVTTLVRTNKLGHNKILHSKRLLHVIESYDASNLDNIVNWHDVG